MKADQLIRQIAIKDRSGRVVGTKEVVTYQGLLSKAHEEGLKLVSTTLVQIPSDDNGRTAIAKAEVETGKGRFEAHGDACPSNVNSFIVPHLIRMAETRAKARALRDAVNVGVVSFEELDTDAAATESGAFGSSPTRPAPRGNGPPNAQRSSPARPDNGNRNTMTEGQRRYLFRILASRGFEGETAHEHLKQLLGVESLGSAGKSEAAQLIDRLLRGEEVLPDGRLQR